MKRKLNKEQTQHLIDLGIAKEKATGRVEIQNGNIGDFEYVFTTDDLLEILPKEIELTDRVYNLDIVFWSNEVIGLYSIGAMFPIMIKSSEELIDVLYELLCWVIDNNYLLN